MLKELYTQGPTKRTVEKREGERNIKYERRGETVREAAALHAAPTPEDNDVAAVLRWLFRPDATEAAAVLFSVSRGTAPESTI